MVNSSIRPMPPNSLKLTQVAVAKLKATHRLSTPITAKKATQARLSRVQTPSGSCSCSPSISLSRLRPNTNWLIRNDNPIAQYRPVGFHLMKVSLCSHTVSPPSTTTSARLIHSIRSTFLPRSLSQATCTSEAMITTTVASITGASAVPTWPPATMKPRCWVANAAAHSLWDSVYLKVPKNSRIGRKSNSSFMRGQCIDRLDADRRVFHAGGLCKCACSGLGHEVDGCRVDAVALAGGLGAVVEDMAQVGAAVRAAHFHPHHAVAGVGDALDAAGFDVLAPAGPAAAGVELGVALKQHLPAAHAAVGAVLPVVPVAAGEGTLGGGLARHLVLHRVELGAPLGLALAHRVARVVVRMGFGVLLAEGVHDEQDTSRWVDQSGGRAA